MRNEDPSLIEKHGFVECGQLIDADLCARIVKLKMHDAKDISNAVEKTLKGPLLKSVCARIGASPTVADAVHTVFGVRAFAVRTVKVLQAEPTAPAQIPHADDFCNRELFGICHLLPDQPRTEAVPYDSAAYYPTNVSVECDKCGQWVALPDRTARRRDHERGNFYCAHAGKTCLSKAAAAANRRKWADWSIDQDMNDATTVTGAAAAGGAAAAAAAAAAQAAAQAEADAKAGGKRFTDASDVAAALDAAVDFDPFAHEVCAAFAPLLHEPAKVLERMRPMGATPRAGDGLIALPTLVHRGPGGDPKLGKRWVLFFTIVPLFGADAGDDAPELDETFEATLGEYDPDAQIHAVWLLWRAAAAVKEPQKVVEAYRRIGFDLDAFGKA